MRTFLEHVAGDLLKKHGSNLSRLVLVFPNKRASLFMNEHLARLSNGPIWSPAYLTIRELFCQFSPLQIGDPIKLVCDLYKIYVQETGRQETLDHFYGWGQLLLTDFDDIDKNLADAQQVFANVRDIHELDDVSYLTEEQKDILKKFFVNFSEDHQTELKRRFLSLWSHLGAIYAHFTDYLRNQGYAYEGMVYRDVAADETIGFGGKTYVFIGFNFLHQAEQKLFRRLRQNGQAAFYWDFDRYFLDNPHSEAGHYLRQYLADFPNELDSSDAGIYAHLSEPKDITYISSSTENLQARYVAQWLSKPGRIEAGRRTAIVLCDEALLQATLHSLPPEVGKVNVTTGYPLSLSPVAAFVHALIALQTQGTTKDGTKLKLRQVSALLRHPYMALLTDKQEQLQDILSTGHYYFLTRDELCLDEGTSLLFNNIDNEGGEHPFVQRLTEWMLQVVRLIGQNAEANAEEAFFHESLFRMYTLLNRLSGLMAEGDLAVDLTTYQRLLGQLIQATSIPFHGEPAMGLQVMGVLETRNLDFDHLLVLSCNEGNLPKGLSDSSFIPYSIRKAHGLTTIDHKAAIYAYHFYSLVQRATDITFCYNRATEDGHTGEMSRFMLQLLVESNHPIARKSLKAEQKLQVGQSRAVEKDPQVLQILQSFERLSPTAINRYLRCPLLFYYNVVAGIKEPDALDEEIDNRTFGNIFHRASELLYADWCGKTLQKSDVEALLKNGPLQERIVDQAFREHLFKIDDNKPMPEYNGLQLINRRVILQYLRQLLTIDLRLAPFQIMGLEIKVQADIPVKTTDGERTLHIGGIVDRLDKVTTADGQEQIRVVDYKTGNTPSQKTNSVEEIFASENVIKKHTDYFLQTILYATIVGHSDEHNADRRPVSPALLFIQHAGGEDYDPTLMLAKDKIVDVARYEEEFSNRLRLLLNEIFDPSVPFRPTAEEDRCRLCPYRHICKLS